MESTFTLCLQGVPEPGSCPREGSVPKPEDVGLGGGEKASRGGSQGQRGPVGGRKSVRYGGASW